MKPYIYLFIHLFIYLFVEACVNERLTPRNPDLEVGGNRFKQGTRKEDKELYSTNQSCH